MQYMLFMYLHVHSNNFRLCENFIGLLFILYYFEILSDTLYMN